MSTKAYDFYIFEKDKLTSFLKWSKKNIEELMLFEFLNNCKLKSLVIERDFEKERDMMDKICKSMSSMSYGDDYDLDLSCGVSIWIWRDKVVIKLYGLKEFIRVKLPSYVKNFEYWNNTDRPDEINYKEWKRRERFFDKTIEKLERLDYSPFNFFTEYGRISSMTKLRFLHKRYLSSYKK